MIGGIMPRIKVKNMPRLRLTDLLRRRKTTLDAFITESGVQTYEALVIRCNRLGVAPPDRSAWDELRPDIVSSPSDGVVVLDPPDVVEESTGRRIDPDAPVTVPEVKVVTGVEEPTQEPAKKVTKRRRRKKVETPTKQGE
jgi:hypothetical protein